MFTIGDFSKLSRVTVKALRHYDKLGIFTPADVDRFTGYRYYTAAQLPRLNRILALKDLGFSLDEVATLLDGGLSPDEIRGMLKMKSVQLEEQLREGQERLGRVESRLRLIEQEETMSEYEVVVKQVEPIKIIGLRGIIPTYQEPHKLWEGLKEYVSENDFAGPCFTLYYDTEYKERDVDAEAAIPIKKEVPVGGDVKIRELPGVSVASTVVKGPYTNLHAGHTATIKWIEENGYKIVGPDREIYIHGYGDTKDEDDFITEVQYPIEKAD